MTLYHGHHAGSDVSIGLFENVGNVSIGFFLPIEQEKKEW